MIKKLPEAVCNTDPKTTIEGHNIFNFNNSIISNMVIDRLKPKKNQEVYKIHVSLIPLPYYFFCSVFDFISFYNPPEVHSQKR
jgi:hypothetical protein